MSIFGFLNTELAINKIRMSQQCVLKNYVF